MPTNAKWTFMVYMAGNNNLSSKGDSDLGEMRKVGSTPDINVVVQFENAGPDGTRRFFIRNGANDEVKSLGKTDSGDPAVVKGFIDWAVGSYPADHYAMILWNHGGGWEPADLDQYAKTLRAPEFTRGEAYRMGKSRLKKTLFFTTLKTVLQKSIKDRAICSDDSTGHSLDTVELGHVVAHAKDTIGQKLDILGMDACLMSNLEVAYEVTPFVNCLVSSEEEEPGQGWPYDTVLKAFNNKPGDSPANLTSAVVKGYIDFYKSAGESGVTQSAFALEKIEDTAKSVDALGEALVGHMPVAASEISTAIKRSKSFFYKQLWDLNQFSMEIAKATSDSDIRKAAGDVQAAIKPGYTNFVLSKSEIGSSYAACGGLSVYLLPPLEKVSEYYADLAFTKDYPNWQKMLQEYQSNW
jgi:hypothetical protein